MGTIRLTANQNEQTSEETAESQGRFRSGIVPRGTIRPEALELHFLSPTTTDPTELALVEQAFDCWKQVWSEAFYELEGTTVLHSDNFTRQDEVAAFFQDGQCMGLICHRIVDFDQPMSRQDSYFEAWPTDALDAAAAHGSKIFISNILTVAPAWRKSEGVPMKELLLAMSIERYMQSDADCWVGTLRNNRGVNTACYRLGCEPLKQDVTFHNCAVDLVALYRAKSDRLAATPETEAVLSALLPRTPVVSLPSWNANTQRRAS